MAWFTGIWAKMLMLNSHVNNHDLTAPTKEKLIAYLEENELQDVLIRVNQYDPKGEWRRLRQNDRLAPGYKYTMGMLSLAGYTLFPGRVFGGDEYNPYTNSLYINSDVAAIALHEAAYAKDIHARWFPGTYAFVNEVPMLAMWRHTYGVNDVLGYARVNVAGATAGHVTGQVALTQRKREHDAELNNLKLDHQSELDIEQADFRGQSDLAGRVRLTNHVTESDEEESQ